MSEIYPILAHPPVVEAVLDLDCDVPSADDLTAMEPRAREVFQDRYPEVQPRYLQEVRVASDGEGRYDSSLRHSLQAWMFRNTEHSQLVQIRQSGFAFNRLQPYISFDEYLPEVERTWKQYCSLVAPISVKIVRLRYINRIRLPLHEVESQGLDHFLGVHLALPDAVELTPTGFLSQYRATDPKSGFQVAAVFSSAPP